MFSKTIQNIRQYYGGIHKFITIGSGNTQSPLSTLNDSSIETMVLYNGNVGIGTNIPTQKLDVRGNIVCSNISVIGDFVTLNTITSNTEQMVIENAGTGPALKVTQTGNNSVAEFYDKESGVALFVGNNGNVGVGTTVPIGEFHVAGSLSNVVVDSRGYLGVGTTVPVHPFQLVSQGNAVIMDSQGNLGIGTNMPIQKIDIAGNIKTTGNIQNASGRPMLSQTGGILQVQNVIASPSSSASGTLLTLNITPSSTSSKILLFATLHEERAGGTTSSHVYVSLLRNGTTIVGSFGNALGWQAPTYFRQAASTTFLDSPSTTSSIAYTFYVDHTNASGILYYWYNISLTAMEIAG